MKKVVFAGLAADALMLGASLLLSLIISAAFPEAVAEYSNSEIFRQMDDPLMRYMLFHPFVMGVILSFIWPKVREQIGGEGIRKGLAYGFTSGSSSESPGC